MSHTTAQDWPTQLRLPGQAAAPEGPVDMQVMYLMHHAFRRDLAQFASAAQHTPVEDRGTWRLLARRWETFSQVLHFHHSGEDAGLWPWLLAHGTDEDRTTLEAMEAEHAEIDPMLAACAQGFERLAEHSDEDARATLAVRLVAARESLARHLAHEETDAIAILQRLMTQEEWVALDEEIFKKELTPRLVVRLVPWAAYGVPREALDRVLADTDPGFKLVWLLTRRRFARREARAFRYAT
jgi:hypothetical protein